MIELGHNQHDLMMSKWVDPIVTLDWCVCPNVSMVTTDQFVWKTPNHRKFLAKIFYISRLIYSLLSSGG